MGGRFGVEPADGGVEGSVACAGGGVAFERGLVEEEVYYFVCRNKRALASEVSASRSRACTSDAVVFWGIGSSDELTVAL